MAVPVVGMWVIVTLFVPSVRMRMAMIVAVRLRMHVGVVMAVRHGVIVVVAALAVFHRKIAELAAVAGQQGMRRTALDIAHTLL